jgi:hypothetical protein
VLAIWRRAATVGSYFVLEEIVDDGRPYFVLEEIVDDGRPIA